MSGKDLDNLGDLLDFKLIPVFNRFDDLEKRMGTMERREISMEKILMSVDKKIDRVEQHLVSEMEDGFAGIGDTIQAHNDRVDRFMSKTNKRLSVLESSK